LPERTVTFLFTDIEGSARLWEQHPSAMRLALARHDALLRHGIEASGGEVFKTVGDAFCAAFATAPEAIASALEVQRAFHAEAWEEVGPLRVRMALHTGVAEERDGDYFGPPLNRVARMLAAAHGGQMLLSLATEEEARDALPEGASLRDLGVHRLRDLARPERIFQLLHPDLPADFPPLRSLEAFAHNLPVQLTSFIGREGEIAEVKRLLATARLLSLTGSGGCGKTRLALQVAADLVEEHEDGVWLVELAALTDAVLVPQTVAAVLGVREEPGRALNETLAEYLGPRSLLLLWDNCEHLIEACAQLAVTLLRTCPHLKLLATSREALGVNGELTHRVPSLSLPDPQRLGSGGTDPVSTVMKYEAVHLFLERACLSQPGFAVTHGNVPAVAQVCRRLDGIPLAIELAAARVKMLSVEQIAARLDDRFRLLTGGSRTALPRQQTLRAAVDWSYDLLSEAERVLLRRLSVFVGGFTLEAAEAVCSGEGVEEYEVLDLLSRLVDKSLVSVEPGTREAGGGGAGVMRYRLLETVRQYGRDRWLEAGGAEVVRERHARSFLRLAEEAEPELQGAQQARWFGRLEEEHDNLRAALAWSRAEAEGGETALRLAGALWWFWHLRGYFSEGQEWLEGVLALPAAAQRTAARAKALQGAAGLALFQGAFAVARPLLEESLAIWRELGDPRAVAYALRGLGWVAMGLGDDAQARSLVEESLAIYRALVDKQGIVRSLNFLGHSTCVMGDYGAARAFWEESLVLSRELGDQFLSAWILYNLGNAAEYEGDYEAARALWGESLAIRRELGIRPGSALSLEALARLASAQGQVERAARLFGAAAALREAIGTPLLPDWLPEWHTDRERLVAAARAELGEEAFAAAWAQGRALTLEEAVTYALAR
jgi:predicted ATPase/class 3 adenylate cyclase